MSRVLFVAGHDLLALRQVAEAEAEGESEAEAWLEFRVRTILGEIRDGEVRYRSTLRSPRLEWEHVLGSLEYEVNQFPVGTTMLERLVDGDRNFRLRWPGKGEEGGEGVVIGWLGMYLPTEFAFDEGKPKTHGPQIVGVVSLSVWPEGQEDRDPRTIHARVFAPGSRKAEPSMNILNEMAGDAAMLRREFPLGSIVRYRPSRGVYVVDQALSSERAVTPDKAEPPTAASLEALKEQFNGDQPSA